jgi:hypothetical protein
MQGFPTSHKIWRPEWTCDTRRLAQFFRVTRPLGIPLVADFFVNACNCFYEPDGNKYLPRTLASLPLTTAQ